MIRAFLYLRRPLFGDSTKDLPTNGLNHMQLHLGQYASPTRKISEQRVYPKFSPWILRPIASIVEDIIPNFVNPLIR